MIIIKNKSVDAIEQTGSIQQFTVLKRICKFMKSRIDARKLDVINIRVCLSSEGARVLEVKPVHKRLIPYIMKSKDVIKCR